MFLREVGYSAMTAEQIMYSHAPVLLLTMNYVITLSKWLCGMKKFMINKSTYAYKAGFKLLLYFCLAKMNNTLQRRKHQTTYNYSKVKRETELFFTSLKFLEN